MNFVMIELNNTTNESLNQIPLKELLRLNLQSNLIVNVMDSTLGLGLCFYPYPPGIPYGHPRDGSVFLKIEIYCFLCTLRVLRLRFASIPFAFSFLSTTVALKRPLLIFVKFLPLQT
jgi:hypothetical protein